MPLASSEGAFVVEFEGKELDDFVKALLEAHRDSKFPRKFQKMNDDACRAFAHSLHQNITSALAEIEGEPTSKERLDGVNEHIDAIKRLEHALSTVIASIAKGHGSRINECARQLAINEESPQNPGRTLASITDLYSRIFSWGNPSDSPLYKLRQDIWRIEPYYDRAFKEHYPPKTPGGIDTTKGRILAEAFAYAWKNAFGVLPPIAGGEEQSLHVFVREILNSKLIEPLVKKKGVKEHSEYTVTIKILNGVIKDLTAST